MGTSSVDGVRGEAGLRPRSSARTSGKRRCVSRAICRARRLRWSLPVLVTVVSTAGPHASRRTSHKWAQPDRRILRAVLRGTLVQSLSGGAAPDAAWARGGSGNGGSRHAVRCLYTVPAATDIGARPPAVTDSFSRRWPGGASG